MTDVIVKVEQERQGVYDPEVLLSRSSRAEHDAEVQAKLDRILEQLGPFARLLGWLRPVHLTLRAVPQDPGPTERFEVEVNDVVLRVETTMKGDNEALLELRCADSLLASVRLITHNEEEVKP